MRIGKRSRRIKGLNHSETGELYLSRDYNSSIKLDASKSVYISPSSAAFSRDNTVVIDSVNPNEEYEYGIFTNVSTEFSFPIDVNNCVYRFNK